MIICCKTLFPRNSTTFREFFREKFGRVPN
nr:MAG TPA: hypothetical protein [Caudoviricetes sp.]